MNFLKGLGSIPINCMIIAKLGVKTGVVVIDNDPLDYLLICG